MPAEYFEARERALLGERYDTLYAAPQETAARGVYRVRPPHYAGRICGPGRFPAAALALLQGGVRGGTA